MKNTWSATNGTETSVATIGLLEQFERGDRERVEAVLRDLRALGVTHLRTRFSWADWHSGEGKTWLSWLIPRLAEEVEVLPCFVETPPELGLEPKRSAPPRRPAAYAEFVGRVLDRFDDCFEWVELWDEPTNASAWARHLDRGWRRFAEMLHGAVEAARARGTKTVLAGVGPGNVQWLDTMGRRDLLDRIDAVGVHAQPEAQMRTAWSDVLRTARRTLDRHDAAAEVWITKAGYATLQHDEYGQLQSFVEGVKAPAERIYWHAARDRAPRQEARVGEQPEPYGLCDAKGQPKLLFRLWADEGLGGVKALDRLDRTTTAPSPHASNGRYSASSKAPMMPAKNGCRPVLITGGAGFIGANLVHRLLSDGEPVLIYDNLSRPGVERNLRWLIEEHGSLLSWTIDDVRNPRALREAVEHASYVFHFAGQVAVTTSIERPEEDFVVNARGTLNLLEALRALSTPPPLLVTSTNKVYGRLSELTLREEAMRYVPNNDHIRANGISEERPIRFHSPYGCSKGAAEQYVLDYARTYDLPALVLRMSCIYGTHQFGTEDQGWVAHFVQRTLAGKPITLYGDGKQVRDILFIDDLTRALLLARSNVETLAGDAFNIGGGPSRAVSLLELIDLAVDLHGERPPLQFADWRRGDQRYYVSDNTKFAEAIGWKPEVGVRDGVRKLYRWLRDLPARTSNRSLLTTDKEA